MFLLWVPGKRIMFGGVQCQVSGSSARPCFFRLSMVCAGIPGASWTSPPPECALDGMFLCFGASLSEPQLTQVFSHVMTFSPVNLAWQLELLLLIGLEQRSRWCGWGQMVE